MSAFDIKDYASINRDMQIYILANQNKLTDFNPGGGMSSFIEAISRQFEQSYIRTKQGFEKYMRQVAYSIFSFTPKPGVQSAGTVVFSANVAVLSDVLVPAGTFVATSNGIEFFTNVDAIILAGHTDSQETAIIASIAGTSGNVPANAIALLPSPIIGVDSVTNNLATTGGQDQESDTEFANRFEEFIEGLGKSSISGLITGAKSVEGVRSASVMEHFPALSGVYHATLYVDDGSGNASADLLADVTHVIDGDGSVDFPGYRAAGIKLRIIAPTVVLIDVTATVTSDGSLDNSVLQNNVELAITNFVNALTISKDVIKNRIIDVIMNITGVFDVDMTVPSTNTAIGSDQIARIGTLAITVVQL